MAVKKEETVAKEVVTATKVADTDKTQVMYMGPNSVAFGLSTGTVYIDGAPPIVDTIKTTYPLFPLLFVPINRLAEARAELNKEASPMAIVVREFNEGGRK